MSARKVDIDLRIDGISGALRVKQVRLKEGISEVTHARVRIASAEDLEFDRSLAQPAILAILLDGVEARRFSLRLCRATLGGIEAGSLQYDLDLYAPIWLLGLCVNTRKFRDQSIEAVVSQVLTERGLPFRWQLVRATEPRSYVTQYRETDLSFACRLLEYEGIYYTTDPDGILVLGDASPSSPEVAGDSHFELLEAAGSMDRDKLGVHAFRRGARVTTGTVTLAEFDWKRPKLALCPSSYSDRDTELGAYDYPGGFRDPDEGQRLARMRLEAERVRAAFAEGSGNVPAFAPAHRFSFGGGAFGRFSGDYLLVHVEHVFEDRTATRANESGAEAVTYENHFQVIPAEVVFRPPLVTPRPTVAGCHTATVRGPSGSEIHTDRYGRFKAQFHWDREATGTDADSRWLRMLQEPATSMNLARTGWEVNVAYIGGDPDRPIGLSRNINGVMAPAYSMPANKNLMTIKTPSSPASGGYNEIKLDDSAGAMCFSLRAEKDYMGVVKHDRSERVSQNEQHRVGQSFQHTVMQNQSLTIGSNSETTIMGEQKLEVKGNRTVRVGGSESVKIEGSANLSTGKNETEKVSSVRLTVAGSFKLPDIKAMAQSAIPNPKAALMGAAQSGAKAALRSMLKGEEAAAGAASAASAVGASLKNMIPTPSGIASQLTGGLSQGVTPEKLIDLFCSGSITRTGEKKITRKVGGAFISAGVGATSTSVGYVHAETIGGAKITVAKGNVTETVKGPLTLTVGSTVLRTSKDEMRIASKSSSIKVGAACSLESDERVEIHGKEVSVKAKANLSLSSGGLAIELAPGKISMKGKLLVEAGEVIVFQGNKDKLTRG